MINQQRTAATATKNIPVQQELLLANELFIQDIEIVKQSRKKFSSILSIAAMLLVPVISTILVIRYISNSYSHSKPVVTTSSQPVQSSVNNSDDTRHPDTTLSATGENARIASLTGKKAPANTPKSRSSYRTSTPVRKSTRSDFVPSSSEPTSLYRAEPYIPHTTRTPSYSQDIEASDIPETSTDNRPNVSSSEGLNDIDRSVFYRPANSKTSGTLVSANDRSPQIARLARQYKGRLASTLEHSGDYYKLKLIIPEKKLTPFKKDLAKIVEYASYTDVPEESIADLRCIILETHFR